MPELLSPPSTFFTPASLFLLLNLMIGTIAIIRFTANRMPPEEAERRPPFARSPSLLDRVRSFNLSFNRHAPVDSNTTSYYQQNGLSDEVDHPPAIERTPSLLDRVKSFNLSFNRHAPVNSDTTSYFPQDGFSDGADRPPAIERSPSLRKRLRSVNFSAVYRSEPEISGDSEAEIKGEAEAEHHRVERSKSEQVAAPERKEAEKLKRSASEKPAEEEEGEGVERRRPATVRYEKTTSFGDEEVDAKADDFINKFKQQLKLQRLDSLCVTETCLGEDNWIIV